jgi:uncharacterized protein
MSVERKHTLLSLIKSNEQKIRSLKVKQLGVFGSFARDTANSTSDVDLLVEFEDGQETLDNFMTLAFMLEDVLGRRVELVTPESLSPYLGPRILKEVEYVLLAS